MHFDKNAGAKSAFQNDKFHRALKLVDPTPVSYLFPIRNYLRKKNQEFHKKTKFVQKNCRIRCRSNGLHRNARLIWHSLHRAMFGHLALLYGNCSLLVPHHTQGMIILLNCNIKLKKDFDWINPHLRHKKCNFQFQICNPLGIPLINE